MEPLQEDDPETSLQKIRELISGYVKESSDAQVHISSLYEIFKWISPNAPPEYKNAADYLCGNIPGLTHTDLRWYASTSKGFSLGVRIHYGLKKLRALRDYARAARITMTSPDPGATVVQVPQPDGTTVDKLFWSCGLEEVQRAVRMKRKPSPKTRAPVSDKVRVLFLAESLARHFQEVAPVRMDARQENGKTLVTVRDVPVAEMDRLIKSLRAGMDEQPFALRDENRGAA